MASSSAETAAVAARHLLQPTSPTGLSSLSLKARLTESKHLHQTSLAKAQFAFNNNPDNY